MSDPALPWVLFGFCGQALFGARFVYQWLCSERAGQSVVPLGFWFLSIGGGLVLFVYAVYRRDPVFIFGQGGGILIYARNLQLVFRERRRPRLNP
jgi:lipid-A-disaccharide synthase-like uncharacterized protein